LYDSATGARREVLITPPQLTPEGADRPLEIAALSWSRARLHQHPSRVAYQFTRRLLLNRLIELGKRFDFMTYPDRTHALEGPGTAAHVYHLLTRYLTAHLPPGRATHRRRPPRFGNVRLSGHGAFGSRITAFLQAHLTSAEQKVRPRVTSRQE
jgi:hypothetical protein